MYVRSMLLMYMISDVYYHILLKLLMHTHVIISLTFIHVLCYSIYTIIHIYYHTLTYTGRFLRIHDTLGAPSYLCHTAGGAEQRASESTAVYCRLVERELKVYCMYEYCIYTI